MAKADTEVGKRQRGYPAKKQKGKKYHPGQDRASLENEIIKLEDENRELKTLLEEERQLRKEINEAYQFEKTRIEPLKKENKSLKDEARRFGALSVALALTVIALIVILIIR